MAINHGIFENLGKFHTKDYEYDLFAPFREIANDIKRMIKIRKKNKAKKKQLT